MSQNPPISGRILVVDDEPVNRQILKTYLERVGFSVSEAKDGPETIAICQNFEFDVILLDVMMPGMSGFDVCAQLKASENFKNVPILFISALNDKQNRSSGVQAGANDYISKPLDLEDIVFRVHNAILLKRLLDGQSERKSTSASIEHVKDELLNMAVHEMCRMTEALSVIGRIEESRLELAESSAIESIESATLSILEVLTSMADLNSLEAQRVELESMDLSMEQVVEISLDALVDRSSVKSVLVEGTLSENQRSIPIMHRILTQLIDHISGQARGWPGQLKISFESDEQNKITVRPLDGQIDIDSHPLSQNTPHSSTYEAGVNIAFCRLAVEAVGGEIGVSKEPGGEASFWFTFPDQSPGVESAALSS